MTKFNERNHKFVDFISRRKFTYFTSRKLKKPLSFMWLISSYIEWDNVLVYVSFDVLKKKFKYRSFC